MRDVIAENATKNGKPDSRQLGCLMRKYKHRNHRGFRLARAQGRSNTSKWRVEKVGGDGGDTKTDHQHDPHHIKPNEYQDKTSLGGDGGDKFPVLKNNISDPVVAEQKRSGSALQLSQSCPSSPPHSGQMLCEKCGASMVPHEMEINGWRNFDWLESRLQSCSAGPGCGKRIQLMATRNATAMKSSLLQRVPPALLCRVAAFRKDRGW